MACANLNVKYDIKKCFSIHFFPFCSDISYLCYADDIQLYTLDGRQFSSTKSRQTEITVQQKRVSGIKEKLVGSVDAHVKTQLVPVFIIYNISCTASRPELETIIRAVVSSHSDSCSARVS